MAAAILAGRFRPLGGIAASTVVLMTAISWSFVSRIILRSTGAGMARIGPRWSISTQSKISVRMPPASVSSNPQSSRDGPSMPGDAGIISPLALPARDQRPSCTDTPTGMLGLVGRSARPR